MTSQQWTCFGPKIPLLGIKLAHCVLDLEVPLVNSHKLSNTATGCGPSPCTHNGDVIQSHPERFRSLGQQFVDTLRHHLSLRDQLTGIKLRLQQQEHNYSQSAVRGTGQFPDILPVQSNKNSFWPCKNFKHHFLIKTRSYSTVTFQLRSFHPSGFRCLAIISSAILSSVQVKFFRHNCHTSGTLNLSRQLHCYPMKTHFIVSALRPSVSDLPRQL